MTWREMSAQQLNSFRDCLLIDVRSPCEHDAEHIPGAINIPLLTNEERRVIGVVYAEKGEMTARFQALRLISPKIPDIVDRILELRTNRQHVVVHCWRGGLRSEAVASFLSVVGIDCHRLSGGYKAWRKQMLKEFEEDKWPSKTIVLHGQTGAGKTLVLQELKQLHQNVVDLEFLANHRGSVFGALGLGEQPTQKNFEGQLWNVMRNLKADSPIFIEGESRKVGRIALPDFIVKRIASGTSVLITCGIKARAERLVNEYANDLNKEQIIELCSSLKEMKQRLGQSGIECLKKLLLEDRNREAVEKILTEYYDPVYQTYIDRVNSFDITLDGEQPKQAALSLVNRLSRTTAANS